MGLNLPPQQHTNNSSSGRSRPRGCGYPRQGMPSPPPPPRQLCASCGATSPAVSFLTLYLKDA